MKTCAYCGAVRSPESILAGEPCCGCGYTQQQAIAENIHRPRRRAYRGRKPFLLLAFLSVGFVLWFALQLSASVENSLNAEERRVEIVTRRLAEAPLIIYGATDCPWTQKALDHAKRLGVEYRYVRTQRGDKNYLESAALGKTRFCLKPLSFTCVPSPIIVTAGEISSGYSSESFERVLRASGAMR